VGKYALIVAPPMRERGEKKDWGERKKKPKKG